jgi:hypothetical protein
MLALALVLLVLRRLELVRPLVRRLSVRSMA